MHILSMECTDIINTDKVARLFVHEEYNIICAELLFYDEDEHGVKYFTLGCYPSYDAALTVLNRIFQALKNKERTFEMPDRAESNLWLHLGNVEYEMRNR